VIQFFTPRGAHPTAVQVELTLLDQSALDKRDRCRAGKGTGVEVGDGQGQVRTGGAAAHNENGYALLFLMLLGRAYKMISNSSASSESRNCGRRIREKVDDLMAS
jgi:hypothetical protein